MPSASDNRKSIASHCSACPWLPRNLMRFDEASSDQSGRSAYEYFMPYVVAILYSIGGIVGFAQRKINVSHS